MFCRRAPDPRPAQPSIRIPAFGFLKAAFSPVFSCFLQKTPRAWPHARSRNEKTRRGMPPGSRRSFGEYALLEDSRYTSQAENRSADKSLNSGGQTAQCASLIARYEADRS
jgi:hypothetical protein